MSLCEGKKRKWEMGGEKIETLGFFLTSIHAHPSNAISRLGLRSEDVGDALRRNVCHMIY